MQTALGGFDFEWMRPTGTVVLTEAPLLVGGRPHRAADGPYVVALGMDFEAFGFGTSKQEHISARGLWNAWLEDAGPDPSLERVRAKAAANVRAMGFPFRLSGDVDIETGARPFEWVDTEDGSGVGVAWYDIRRELEQIVAFERTRQALADANTSITERDLESMVVEGADGLAVVLPGDETATDDLGYARSSHPNLSREDRRIVAQGALRLWRSHEPRRAERCRALVAAWMATHLNGQLARTTSAGVPTNVGFPHSPVSFWPLDLFGAMWLVSAQHFIGERSGFECANPKCRKWVAGKRSHARFCDSSVCRREMSPKQIAKRAAPVANR